MLVSRGGRFVTGLGIGLIISGFLALGVAAVAILAQVAAWDGSQPGSWVPWTALAGVVAIVAGIVLVVA